MIPKIATTIPILVILVSFSLITPGCSVEASKTSVNSTDEQPVANTKSRDGNATKGATIKIEPNSPADTVRVFYKNLREKRFREAIYMTNLRPAVEGLTDSELKEFQVDFEAIAAQIPQEVEINGEIVSGDSATVTAKLPSPDTDKPEIQEIRLRNEAGIWIILTVDDAAEKRIKQEGKNYFYALRIETHEDEARKMLDRISKAQIAYSASNGGLFGEMQALIEAGFLPPDVQSSESTGYNYVLKLASDKKRYSATATPAEYGKTGRLSFGVELDGKGMPRLNSKDNGGKPYIK